MLTSLQEYRRYMWKLCLRLNRECLRFSKIVEISGSSTSVGNGSFLLLNVEI